MDTIFDAPRWEWRLITGIPPITHIGRHDMRTSIVKPGRDEPEVLKQVYLVPPTDTFFFLFKRGADVEAESYYQIVVERNRAYLDLYVVGGHVEPQYRLFYWTKSNAPVWLKKYL